MARKETIESIETILVLLFNTCKKRIPLKLKIGKFKAMRGQFHMLEQNSLQIMLEDPNARLTPDKEARIISDVPDKGTIDFTTKIIGSGKIRREAKTSQFIQVLSLPRRIMITDRRSEQRHKILLKDNIWVYFNMTKQAAGKDKPDDKAAAGKDRPDDKAAAGKGSKRSIIQAQVIDMGPEGVRTLVPRDRNKLNQLWKAEPPLPGTIEFPDMEVSLQFSLLKGKLKEAGPSKFLRFSFHRPSETASKQLRDFINARKQEVEEKALNRIMMVLKRQSKIIDPRTLRDEMTEEELDRLKWRRKGDVFFIQTDRFFKGEEAFQIFVPKKNGKDVWVRRRS
jgi:hypothetical protein